MAGLSCFVFPVDVCYVPYGNAVLARQSCFVSFSFNGSTGLSCFVSSVHVLAGLYCLVCSFLAVLTGLCCFVSSADV